MTVRTHLQRPANVFTAASLVCALTAYLLPQPAAAAETATQRVWVIPHTHWEGTVFKTREEYLDVGLPNILKALELLRKYPDYRFVLDQMCYVRPFLDRYPAEEPAFREFLAQGRLQIAGGTDTMHDTNVPAGESIVRQFLLGKTYFRERLGYDVTTGWAIDTFGHNAQMPQILKLAGMKSYWFQRGAPGRDTPSEFLWQGIDGTRIPAFWLPLGYGIFYPGMTPSTQIEFEARLLEVFDRLTPFSYGTDRALMAGADVMPPEESIPVMLGQFNRSAGAPFKTRFAVPAEFEAVVAKRTDRKVMGGELNPVFQGGYSSRTEVKQAMRDSERALTTAEKLGAIASFVGGTSNPEVVARAWEPVLFNQAHDPAIGVMSDKVYQEVTQTYEQARRLADGEVRQVLESIFARIDTSGKGVPIAVFNSLGWRRTDVAEVEVAFSAAGIRQFALFDAVGQAVPVQVLSTARNGDGTIRGARIAFIARQIPALGYAVYRAVPNAAGPRSVPTTIRTSMHDDYGTLENELYRVTFDLWTGAMTSLVVKDRDWEVLTGPGNVVAREEDGGDLWELYGTLNAARLTAMQRPVSAPRPAFTRWSHDFSGGGGGTLGNYGGQTTTGPVFSEFQVKHPFGKSRFATRVRLYHGLRRIDIRTDITNQEEQVRYRAMFPTSMAQGTAMQEIAFGAIERAQSQEFPAQNWMHYGDGRRGLTLINRAMPGNNVVEGKMLLSLARSFGADVGRQYTLDYALVPHVGDWRAAAPWRDGLEFNTPLIAQTVTPHAGELPAQWGLLEVSQDNVVVSALKLAKDGTAVLRLYEAAGKVSRGVRIVFRRGIGQVREANLIEDTGGDVKSSAEGFTVDLQPFEIRTFKIASAAPQITRR